MVSRVRKPGSQHERAQGDDDGSMDRVIPEVLVLDDLDFQVARGIQDAVEMQHVVPHGILRRANLLVHAGLADRVLELRDHVARSLHAHGARFVDDDPQCSDARPDRALRGRIVRPGQEQGRRRRTQPKLRALGLPHVEAHLFKRRSRRVLVQLVNVVHPDSQPANANAPLELQVRIELHADRLRRLGDREGLRELPLPGPARLLASHGSRGEQGHRLDFRPHVVAFALLRLVQDSLLPARILALRFQRQLDEVAALVCHDELVRVSGRVEQVVVALGKGHHTCESVHHFDVQSPLHLQLGTWIARPPLSASSGLL
eukprot:scaffold30_cov255-Pinguiococcus_pyrenoidosus.AAC.7